MDDNVSRELTVRFKVQSILDQKSFREFSVNYNTRNILSFTGYDEKIKKAKEACGEVESVITGIGKISGFKSVIIALEPLFMMGSMGLITGEKVAKAFEYATQKKLPVISFSASGGARMQEGIFSLMQMVKTAGAVSQHSQKGLLYISIICDPTLGGVTASYASLGDIIIAESGARYGFTGKKIIEQTTHELLPDDFQTAEYALKHGMVDLVVKKEDLRDMIVKLIRLHKGGGALSKH